MVHDQVSEVRPFLTSILCYHQKNKMVIWIALCARRIPLAIRINRPLTSFVRPTQTGADKNDPVTTFKQAVLLTGKAFSERHRESGLEICVRVCLWESAVNIIKNQKELWNHYRLHIMKFARWCPDFLLFENCLAGEINVALKWKANPIPQPRTDHWNHQGPGVKLLMSNNAPLTIR